MNFSQEDVIVSDGDDQDMSGVSSNHPLPRSRHRKSHGQSSKTSRYVPLEIDLDDDDSFSLQQLSLTRQSVKHTHIKQKPAHSYTPRTLTGAEYTNISCRFVLRPGAFSPLDIDVDRPIDHKDVLRIVTSETECPICLDAAPVAPRMLGCGHLLCLTCLINHARYAEKSTCPVCNEPTSLDPGKSMPVTFLQGDARFLPQPGHEIVLTLMHRSAGSAVSFPATHPTASSSKTQLPGPDALLWSRLVEGTAEYSCAELDRELHDVVAARKQAIADGDGDEGYSEALSELRREKSATLASLSSSEQFTKRAKTAAREIKRADSSSDFWYYESGFDGPEVYVLDSLDVSILKAAYGDYPLFPTSLVVRVNHTSTVSLTGPIRRQKKYLDHLPDQTPIVLLECDWRNVVDRDVLRRFNKKLAARRQQRRVRESKENEDRRHADAALDAQFRADMAEGAVELPAVPFGGIDSSKLPTLAPAQPTSVQQTPKSTWVDHEKEYEELMQNAYVPKRGRKQIILRST